MSTDLRRVPGLANQVTESTLDHKLKGLSRACCVACNHRTTRHNRTDRRSARIQALGSDLRTSSSSAWQKTNEIAHPESKVLCRENATQTFLVIDYQDTIRSLGCAELARVRNRHALGDRQRGAWLEGGNGSLCTSHLGQFFVS
jgi:hypothetical protein